MHVLLTCAGRRNYLVEYFRSAVGDEGAVLAADSSPDAPALQVADEAHLLPPVAHGSYVTALADLCREGAVDLVVSLNDLELPVLAPHRERFAAQGTVLGVSSPTVVAIAGDKWRTATFLAKSGIPTAKTYLRVADAEAALSGGEISFPLVVKPRWGTASIAVDVVHAVDELRVTARLTRERLATTILAGSADLDPDHPVLVQEALTGVEHGLDVVNDLDGRYVATLARRKLTMRAGETDRAETVVDARLTGLGERIGRALGHVGLLDCDVFLDGDGVRVLELNARFGGGYPFSHAAGADVPAAMVAWTAGDPIDASWLQVRAGVRSAKADGLVVLDPARITVRGTSGPLRGL